MLHRAAIEIDEHLTQLFGCVSIVGNDKLAAEVFEESAVGSIQVLTAYPAPDQLPDSYCLYFLYVLLVLLLQDVLGGRPEITAADIPKLVVAEACFREALRLHPPAPQIGRDAARDTVLKVRQYALQ
jgi:hypothetical protein